MKKPYIDKQKVAQVAGVATKETVKVVGKVAAISAQTSKTSVGKKILTFFVPFIASTIGSMVFLSQGRGLPLWFDLFVGLFGGYVVYHVLTYEKPKPKKNNEPNFDKLSDKEKARLAKISEDQQYLMWKASR